jgi:hypothetical protein
MRLDERVSLLKAADGADLRNPTLKVARMAAGMRDSNHDGLSLVGDECDVVWKTR